jgi:hypothetical protein
LLDIIQGIRNVDGLLVVGNWTAKEFNLDDLKDNVGRLQRTNMTVGLVGVAPIFSASIPRLHETGKITPDFGNLLSFMEPGLDPFGRDRFLKGTAHGTVTYIDVIDTLCGQACDAYNGGKIMYFDRDHLSLDGVRYLLSHGVYLPIIDAIERPKARLSAETPMTSER